MTLDSRPAISPDLVVVSAPNPAARVRFAFEGGDLGPLIAQAHAAMADGKVDPAALIDLGVLYQLAGQPDDALVCQQAAIRHRRLYRHPQLGPGGVPAKAGMERPLRLLALVAAGDLMTNTPVDLMLEGCAVEVTKLYVSADDLGALELPDHDLALLAVGESDATAALLDRLDDLAAVWPRPVMNDAGRIKDLARERLFGRLHDAPGLYCPPTVRVARDRLVTMLAKGQGPETIVEGAAWPIIVRPVGSHAGRGLEKIDSPPALIGYLTEQPATQLYVSPFVDYASADGRFRKYRIAFFDGSPFLCHLAVGDHWMVHYLNADMAGDRAKRAEEQAAMEGFADFARRHAHGFEALHDRVGLDYFAIDCAELADGRILVFEADVAMIVHDLDPATLYPYKKPQMRKVFDAFEALLRAKAGVNQT